MAQYVGGYIAVVPGELRLPVDIEAVLAEPGQRAAKTVAVGVDGTLAEQEETSVEISPYWNVTHQRTGLVFVELAVKARLQPPRVVIIVRLGGGAVRIDPRMRAVDACP